MTNQGSSNDKSSPRNNIIDIIKMMNEQFEKLWNLAQRESKKLDQDPRYDYFNPNPANVFSDLGLLLFEPVYEHWGYRETPLNAVTFGSTGVDGDHFSFLSKNGRLLDPSPIVMTVPMAPIESCNIIVGEDLVDFLSLGYKAHFASLAALAFSETQRREFFKGQVDQISMWEGENPEDPSVISQKYLSKLLETEFELLPWQDIEIKLNELSIQYYHLLELRDNERAQDG